MTGDFIWHREDVLHQLAVPYDPLRPFIYVDERPCFLLEDMGASIPISPGKAKRYHDEYHKHGSCCVFLVFEPHTGFRYVEVRDRRTAVDDAEFMQNLVTLHYPRVASIRLVQDNLNTHTPGAFYEVLTPAQAFELACRFAPHDTPKKGSWLNMAEMEFAALATPCLNRRLPERELLRREVLAGASRRHQPRNTIDWKVSQNDARGKFQRHYAQVQKFN
jgi:DDE superfamily endonuclease